MIPQCKSFLSFRPLTQVYVKMENFCNLCFIQFILGRKKEGETFIPRQMQEILWTRMQLDNKSIFLIRTSIYCVAITKPNFKPPFPFFFLFMKKYLLFSGSFSFCESNRHVGFNETNSKENICFLFLFIKLKK